MAKMHWWQWSILMLMLGGVGGCGQGLVPVEGVITVDGVPVEKGTHVLFAPLGKTRPAAAKTDEHGVFHLTTTTPSDGVMPGEYKVVLVNSMELVLPPDHEIKRDDDPAYLAYMKALERAKKGKVNLVPPRYSNPTSTPLKWTVPDDGRKAVFQLDSRVRVEPDAS